jgi:hypothetical protein
MPLATTQFTKWHKQSAALSQHKKPGGKRFTPDIHRDLSELRDLFKAPAVLLMVESFFMSNGWKAARVTEVEKLQT